MQRSLPRSSLQGSLQPPDRPTRRRRRGWRGRQGGGGFRVRSIFFFPDLCVSFSLRRSSGRFRGGERLGPPRGGAGPGAGPQGARPKAGPRAPGAGVTKTKTTLFGHSISFEQISGALPASVDPCAPRRISRWDIRKSNRREQR